MSAPGGWPTNERGSLVARLMGLARRNKRVVQALALALIAVFVAVAIYKSWSALRDYHWQVQWGLLALGFLFLIAQELMFALIWRSILRRLGSSLDIITSERIYLGAEFVRYIPGNVWHVITRVVWAEQRGVPKAIGFASMVVELATKILSAALVFAVSLLFWPDVTALTTQAHIPPNVALIAGAVAIPLLLLGLHPRLLEAALNTGLRLLKREPTRLTLGYLDLLVITLFWSLSWVVAGVGFYLLTRSIVTTPLPAALLPLAMGIYALGWDVGFLSFITPSGIGFREAGHRRADGGGGGDGRARWLRHRVRRGDGVAAACHWLRTGVDRAGIPRLWRQDADRPDSGRGVQPTAGVTPGPSAQPLGWHIRLTQIAVTSGRGG